MKKSEELLGLSVISIEDGKEIGRVSDLIINPSKGIVEYLIIDNGLKYLGFKVLPFKQVEGVGEYAVTVQSSSAVIDMSDEPGINELLEKDVRIKGTKVLTRKGQLVGTVNEFLVDEDEDGKISGCKIKLVNNENTISTVDSEQIITFGKDVLVINEIPGNGQPDGPDENKTANTSLTEQKQNNEEINMQQTVTTQQVTNIPPQQSNNQENVQGTKPQAEEAKQEVSEAAKLFEQRQRQYLVGRKVSKRIENDKGEIIAEEGQVITNELIDKVKANGKFAELSMNTKA